MPTEVLETKLIKLAGRQVEVHLQKQTWGKDNENVRYVIHGAVLGNNNISLGFSLTEQVRNQDARLKVIEEKLTLLTERSKE